MSEQTAQEPRPASEQAPNGDAETNGASLRCPNCGAPVSAGDAFCESCRQPLTPQAEAPPAESSDSAAPIEITRTV